MKELLLHNIYKKRDINNYFLHLDIMLDNVKSKS